MVTTTFGAGKLTSSCIQNVDISLNGLFTMLTEFHSSIAFGTRSSSGLVLSSIGCVYGEHVKISSTCLFMSTQNKPRKLYLDHL